MALDSTAPANPTTAAQATAAQTTSAQPTLVPVILCGGTGTRLWPLSRATYPKQYWALAGDTDDTLLQQTQQRLGGLP
ncbi:MAG: sugar phosphate nucleotidyltransferase, partial [Cyanobium sp.]